MRLQFTRSAARDLVRLRDFISQHDPRAAARIGQRLVRTIGLAIAPSDPASEQVAQIEHQAWQGGDLDPG